jgi:hypothetical protein
MKLLVDEFNHSQADVKVLINEAEQGQKKYYIKGIFAQAETLNRNGRNYPRASMDKALREYTSLITKKRALGELNHPNHPNVNLERASHLIESLEWEGNNLIGQARILTEMPMGKIAKGLIDEGVQIGVSTRGLGSLVKKNGVNFVQEDYVITAIDIVGDPSAPDAFVEGIMEGSDWLYNISSNSWVAAESIRKSILSSTVVDVERKKAKLLESFLKSL